MNDTTLSELQDDIVRDRTELQLRLGMLQDKHADETEYFNEPFEVYDAFHNIHLMDKPAIRTASNTRGKIDALQFILHGNEPPVTIDALDESRTSTALVDNIDKEIRRNANGMHEHASKTAQVDYLRGWRHALRYVFDTNHDDWNASKYRHPIERKPKPETR